MVIERERERATCINDKIYLDIDPNKEGAYFPTNHEQVRARKRLGKPFFPIFHNYQVVKHFVKRKRGTSLLKSLHCLHS